MNKRDIFFGFGAGLLVAASILGITTQKEAPGTHQSLTKEQLETAAEELQLVVLSKEEFNQLQQEKRLSSNRCQPRQRSLLPLFHRHRISRKRESLRNPKQHCRKRR